MTKSTETEIAVLQTQMQDVKASLEVIKAEQHTNFQAIAAKIDQLANTPQEIETLKNGFDERLKALEHSHSMAWVWNTLSALAGIFIASLLIYAITKK